MKPNKTLEIMKPSNQLKLFGYEKYFNFMLNENTHIYGQLDVL